MTLLRVVIGFIYGLMYVPVLLLFLVIAPMVTEANGIVLSANKEIVIYFIFWFLFSLLLNKLSIGPDSKSNEDTWHGFLTGGVFALMMSPTILLSIQGEVEYGVYQKGTIALTFFVLFFGRQAKALSDKMNDKFGRKRR
jgi:hypothetical protein